MKYYLINKTLYNTILVLTTFAFLTSCEKEFLDEKANKKMVVPESLSDFQGMMDFIVMNGNCPYLGEAASDDHYTTEVRWNNTFNNLEKNTYSWTRSFPVTTTYGGSWDLCYNKILYSNVVLEGLKNISPASVPEKEQWHHVEAQALFHRAKNFFLLSEVFAPPYQKAKAGTDLSIPIRTAADIAVPSTRATVQEVYDKIVSDLKTAAESLPERSTIASRPTRPAAYAVLSRLYLATQQFDSALKYSNKCLQIRSELLDYNILSVSANAIGSNKEIIFHDIFTLTSNIRFFTLSLYNMYETNDLRKTLFFRRNPDGTYIFKGNYNTFNGSGNAIFCGSATDEVYLTRAECYARTGETILAAKDINDLMKNRYKKVNNVSTWTDKVFSNADDALVFILTERRKELIYRGLRWSDLRRLNLEDRFKVTLTRTIGGKTYTLEPNSYKYAMPFPDYVIQQSTMPQNPGWE